MTYRLFSLGFASTVAPRAATMVLLGSMAACAAGCGGRATSGEEPADAGVDAPGFVPKKRDAGAAPDAAGESPDAEPAAGGCPTAPGGTYRPAHPSTCSESEQKARWGVMTAAPIVPPNRAGGLDLRGPSGPNGWFDDVWALDCEPASIEVEPDCVVSAAWGSSSDVFVNYDLAGARPIGLAVANGYSGTLDFQSPDKATSYRIGTFTLNRNGRPLRIPWDSTELEATMDELYRAMMATFAPAAPVAPEGTTCFQTKKCRTSMQGTTSASMYFDPLGLTLLFEQPAPLASPVAILLEPR